MKITKTAVYRLQLDKDCSCRAVKEFSDMNYTKPIGDGTVILCEKHSGKAKDTKEMLTEMLLETLELQAGAISKTPITTQRQVQDGDTGGVSAIFEAGGSTQAMGVVMPKIREKQNPLATKTLAVNRPPVNRPTNTNLKNLAGHEDISPEEIEAEGITLDYTTDDVPLDPRLATAAETELRQLESIFEDEDMKESGVPLSALRQATD